MAKFGSFAAKGHSDYLFPFVGKLKIGKLEGAREISGLGKASRFGKAGNGMSAVP